MKTQISNLRSGTKNQFRNKNTDYATQPSATSHSGHAGTPHVKVDEVWQKIMFENSEKLNIEISGRILELEAKWSLSRKSVRYRADIPKDMLDVFGLIEAKRVTPYISIQGATTIIISNGKNDYRYLCPSFIKILD